MLSWPLFPTVSLTFHLPERITWLWGLATPFNWSLTFCHSGTWTFCFYYSLTLAVLRIRGFTVLMSFPYLMIILFFTCILCNSCCVFFYTFLLTKEEWPRVGDPFLLSLSGHKLASRSSWSPIHPMAVLSSHLQSPLSDSPPMGTRSCCAPIAIKPSKQKGVVCSQSRLESSRNRFMVL